MTTSNNRNPTDLCLLCKERESSKRNSHIIPRFIGKGLFEGIKPRHSVMMSLGKNSKKVQDIIKEDYIFCPECEASFSLFETYCSSKLENFNDLKYCKNYIIIKKGEFEYFEAKFLNIKMFNLFIYSIIWRVSISDNYAFQKFKLPTSEEERLRTLLSKYICSKITDLIVLLDNLNELPKHSHIIIRPNKKQRPPESMLSAISADYWIHQLYLVDYIIIYLTDRQKLINQFKEIDNNNLNRLLRVGLSKPEIWKSYNYDLMSKYV